MRSITVGAVALVACGLAGCGGNVSDHVPTLAVDFAETSAGGIPVKINKCTSDAAARIETGTQSYPVVTGKLNGLYADLPLSIRNDPVVQMIMAYSEYVSSRASKAASRIAGLQTLDSRTQVVAKPSFALAPLHVHGFAQNVSQNILRQTPSSPEQDAAVVSRFWTKVKTYYMTYFDGNFTDYFGNKFDQPKMSATIGDPEIVASVSVFLELLMDEIFTSPVWVGKDTKWYPAGNGHKPTAVLLNPGQLRDMKLEPKVWGCGMNVPKANAVRYLAAAFSQAAVAESGLAIKSVGGVEFGFGILGKVNIGDNSTLTLLVQALIKEVVGRLTVALAVPVLSAIDLEQQDDLKKIHEQSLRTAAAIGPAAKSQAFMAVLH